MFFNEPEESTSTSKIANPNIGIDDALVNFFGTASAGDKVYAAFYSSTTQKITNAIIEADINTGGGVYHIMDRDNGAGYSFLGARSINNSAVSAQTPIMHNKFVVVIDTNSETGRVWTGSYNPNQFGTINSNQNSVWIESYELAEIFAGEFLYMWNNGDGKFSTNKVTSSYTASSANVGGATVDVYFSPYNDDHMTDTSVAIARLIDNAKHSIYFNMFVFSFNEDRINGALRRAHDRGVEVKGVVEGGQSTSRTTQEELSEYGIDILLDGNPDHMHHKFAIIDYGMPGSKVITGSYNWTPAARDSHDENFLVISSSAVATLFWREFQKVYSIAAGGTALAGKPAVEKVLVYPSPSRFVDEVTIGYTLSPVVSDVEITVYTLMAEKVIGIEPDFYPGADNEIIWNLKNTAGSDVASGLYIVQVSAETGDGIFHDTQKFAVIR